MKIAIFPYSKPLRNGNRNPKNYPYWDDVCAGLMYHEHKLTQLNWINEPSINGNVEMLTYITMRGLDSVLKEFDLWISVDNFVQHMANIIQKRGIVIWGVSDPNLFGYPQNINLLKDRKYLRPNQFDIWDSVPYSEEVFVSADVVIDAVQTFNS